MSKKKKHHQQQNHQTAAAAASGTVVVVAPATPEEAMVAIKAANDAAVDAATDADIELAAAASPSTDPSKLDLVAAAKLIDETVALWRARDEHLNKRDEKCTERERALDARDEAQTKRRDAFEADERALKADQSRVKEDERKVNARLAEFDAREKALRERELNAEANFARERRESLRQLDAEAATLRDELSRARAQIANERAAWEAERSAEDQRRREEQRRALEAQEARRAQAEAESAERTRIETEGLARQRTELNRLQREVADQQEVLREDRQALDQKVAQRAARALEAATAERQALEGRLSSAREARDALQEQLRQRDEAVRVLGNRPPEELKRELDALIKERDSLKAQLAKRPNQDVTDRLATLERAQEEWESERARLTQESVTARAALAKASIAVTELETLRDQKAALESARDLLHTALEELRKDVNERIRRADGVSPFPACSLMDSDSALQIRSPVTDEIRDLKAFTEDLQHRIAIDPANQSKVLYYGLRDIRCFLGGLAMSRLHLLHGISGTGKTSLPLAVARALGAGSTLVEVQAGWRDRQDLIGHFNAFERRFYESEFLQALYRAQCPRHRDLVNIIVLDEMNLSHPEQYFADLLSALEQDPRRQKLDLMTAPVEPAPAHLQQGRTLAIPENVWFVGTANHDETTKDFADKTYDRAHVMELPRHRAQFTAKQQQARHPVSFEALRSAFSKAQKEREADAKRAYDFLEESFAEILGRRFGVGWGNRLERQMLDFVPVVMASGGTLGEAVDHILATKLLRKIRDRHDTRQEDLTSLRDRVVETWPSIEKSDATKLLSTAIISEELRRTGAEEDA